MTSEFWEASPWLLGIIVIGLLMGFSFIASDARNEKIIKFAEVCMEAGGKPTVINTNITCN